MERWKDGKKDVDPFQLMQKDVDPFQLMQTCLYRISITLVLTNPLTLVLYYQQVDVRSKSFYLQYIVPNFQFSHNSRLHSNI